MLRRMAEISNIEVMTEDSDKCFQFFYSRKYEVGSEDFYQQLWCLAKMTHISFNHLKTEFKAAPLYTTKQEPDHFEGADLVTISSQDNTVSEDSFPDDPETSVSTSAGAQDPGVIKEADYFIRKALKAIKAVAPNLKYKPKHLRRKKFKVIPYEFASVWRNVSSIFSEEEEGSRHNQESFMPEVAWERVNVAALRKLPVPKNFPILSASPLPQFYSKADGCPKKCPQTSYVQGETRQFPCSCRLGYETTNPFGALLGFESNLGVVPVPSAPMFGHIWDADTSSWLLHAEIPLQGKVPGSDLRQDRRRRGRRPPERRTRGRGRRR